MEFATICAVLEKLEATPGRLAMGDIVSEFLKSVPQDELANAILIMRGTTFPPWDGRELGVSDKLIIRVIAQVSGAAESKVEDLLRETGDLGSTAETALVNKPQTTLFTETLTVEKVMQNISKLADLTGKGSQDRKLAYISELLSNASSIESRFIIRLILSQLRVGVGDGTIRDSVSKAYGVDSALVERAFNLRPDWAEVAACARDSGDEGLSGYGITLGRPIKVMLAQKSEGLSQIVEKLGRCQYEYKYDGARIQIHKDGDNVRLFTRRLEDVTAQFPEIVSLSKTNIKATAALVEGEAVAFDAETKRPQPFQNLSRRIKRKYDILKLAEKIPVEMNMFDIVYLEGETLTGKPFEERRNALADVIEESQTFRLAKSLVSSDIEEVSAFYADALSAGHEGVMAKVLDSPYQPGSRVGYMYKVKPVMETLDLVVTGATWGEGRRASWLGSYLLSAYDPESGMYLSIGRMATGLTDEKLAELTDTLKPMITMQSGSDCVVRPSLVFEVEYEEIQTSLKYESGYALRFPRLVRVRTDKSPEEADNIGRVESLVGGVG